MFYTVSWNAHFWALWDPFKSNEMLNWSEKQCIPIFFVVRHSLLTSIFISLAYLPLQTVRFLTFFQDLLTKWNTRKLITLQTWPFVTCKKNLWLDLTLFCHSIGKRQKLLFPMRWLWPFCLQLLTRVINVDRIERWLKSFRSPCWGHVRFRTTNCVMQMNAEKERSRQSPLLQSNLLACQPFSSQTHNWGKYSHGIDECLCCLSCNSACLLNLNYYAISGFVNYCIPSCRWKLIS